MRIARVLTRLNLGGPARQVLAGDPVLLERGHELRIFVGTPAAGEGDLFDLARERGLDVVRIPGLTRGPNPLGDLRAEWKLRRELIRFKPDVLHTHATKAGMIGRRAGRKLGRIGRVHTFHGHVLEGYFPEPVSRLLIRREKKLAAETDRIVAVSHATADDLVRLGVVEEPQLVVIPPGVDLDRFLALERPRAVGGEPGELRRRIGAEAGDFLLGCVARLAPVKQPQHAVDLFELLARRHPRLQLVFIGDGSERLALERRIRSLEPGFSERVHLLGALEHMPAVFAELDAVLLTSHSEGMPVALIEAAAAGLPAIATAVGGVPEIVAHERTGFIGETTEDLAFGLDQLMANPAECLAMGKRARMRVAQRHSGRQLANRLEELYQLVHEEATCAS